MYNKFYDPMFEINICISSKFIMLYMCMFLIFMLYIFCFNGIFFKYDL